ncbi:hypothetical protein HZS_5576 [Henneguya salminicola]|nr:hypothetical protein HZS_5576 [Henneguya salminicola]
MIIPMEYTWMPRNITVDFNYSLISAVNTNLPRLPQFKVCMESTNTKLSKIEPLTIFKISEVIDGINSIKSLLFPPSLWNINAYRVYHLVGRTSNCLERYNRNIGVFFSTRMPNMAVFISVINAEFDFYSEKYKEARENASGIVKRRERFKKPNDLKRGKTIK